MMRLLLLILFSTNFISLSAQCWQLVWEDEFSGSTLDYSKWSHQTGESGWGNNELQYYTNGTNNVTVSNGTLKIIAREENFSASNYTSARIRSINQGDWTYGKMEARIKLPAGQGIWPAFWMMPTQNTYGTWPSSGEIDIMELLGHQNATSHGTCHYGNSPSDKGQLGSSSTLSSGTYSDDFHVFSVEWSATEIRWYIDGSQFYTVSSSHPDFSTYTWPFNHDFHFILNVAVGGNWPGAPDATTVFPAQMEVDWVRTYQDASDINLSGATLVEPTQTNVIYSVPNIAAATYTWSVPSGATIVNGQNTNQITVNWGNISGDITANITTTCGTEATILPVTVSPNLWENYNFENNYNHWVTTTNNGATALFSIDNSNPQEGNSAACVSVNSLASNPWDVQLRRTGIDWIAGEDYTLSFWAKSDQANTDVDVAFINESTFAYYAGTSFQLSNQWSYHTFNMTASTSAQVSCNFDLGDELGDFCFDDMSYARTALVLPLELVSFQARRAKESQAQITWQIAQAENVSHFELERTPDLLNWKIVGRKDFNNSSNFFAMEDNNAPAQTIYYRLKSVDLDGNFQYSQTVRLEQINSIINIYPNPGNNQLYITGENISHVDVYNQNHKLVLSRYFETQDNIRQLDCATLTSGFYLIKVINKGKTEWLKWVKN